MVVGYGADAVLLRGAVEGVSVPLQAFADAVDVRRPLGRRAEEALTWAAFVVVVPAVVQDGPLGGERHRGQDDPGE